MPELAAALGIPENAAVQIVKACYGLANAPRQWFLSCDKIFKELGFRQCKTEPCCWLYPRGGHKEEDVSDYEVEDEIIGFICGQVDDFLVGGSETDDAWQEVRGNLKEALV